MLNNSTFFSLTTDNWPFVFSLLFSVIALFISYKSFSVSKSNADNNLRTTLIDKAFEAYYELGLLRLENPMYTHLFETTENYGEACKKTHLLYNNDKYEALLKKVLKEKALAMLIFTCFENTYSIYNHLNQDDSRRNEFISSNVNYFTNTLLRNPRLLFMWNEKGGKMCAFFGEDARAYYYDNVIKPYENQGIDIMNLMDAKGPFYHE